MDKLVRIYASKQPRRPHFIREWMLKRRLSAADMMREIGVDKSLVSRWLKGATPGVEWQAKLAALFACEPESLFRHPDDDWLKHLFAKHKKLKSLLIVRTDKELDRIQTMIEAAFPPAKDGTSG